MIRAAIIAASMLTLAPAAFAQPRNEQRPDSFVDAASVAPGLVVEARYAGESDAAIPADRLLVEHGGGQIALFLRPGDYRITASNASAHVITTQRLHVDATSAATRAPSTTR